VVLPDPVPPQINTARSPPRACEIEIHSVGKKLFKSRALTSQHPPCAAGDLLELVENSLA
jgi:hypothetical protein